MKKYIKIVFILLLVSIVLICSNTVLAYKDSSKVNEKISLPSSNQAEYSQVKSMAKSILTFLQWASIIGTVIVITFLGIKYMMGSLEEKAQYKKSMVPLVVGVFIVTCATTIVKLLFDVFSGTT